MRHKVKVIQHMWWQT